MLRRCLSIAVLVLSADEALDCTSRVAGGRSKRVRLSMVLFCFGVYLSIESYILELHTFTTSLAVELHTQANLSLPVIYTVFTLY